MVPRIKKQPLLQSRADIGASGAIEIARRSVQWRGQGGRAEQVKGDGVRRTQEQGNVQAGAQNRSRMGPEAGREQHGRGTAAGTFYRAR